MNSFRKCVLLVIFHVFSSFSRECTSDDPPQPSAMFSESIDDGWIRSHTLASYYVPTIVSRPSAAAQVIVTTTAAQPSIDESQPPIDESPTFSQDQEAKAALGFKVIDAEFATMKPSDKFEQFSKIRADAISLQFYSLMKNPNGGEDELLPAVQNYFDEWPTIPVENWLDQLSPNEMSQYVKYAEKYVTESPPLTLRWIIFTTWLTKTEEWNDCSKVPEPYLSQLSQMSTLYRNLNEMVRIPIVRIALSIVEAYKRNSKFV